MQRERLVDQDCGQGSEAYLTPWWGEGRPLQARRGDGRGLRSRRRRVDSTRRRQLVIDTSGVLAGGPWPAVATGHDADRDQRTRAGTSSTATTGRPQRGASRRARASMFAATAAVSWRRRAPPYGVEYRWGTLRSCPRAACGRRRRCPTSSHALLWQVVRRPTVTVTTRRSYDEVRRAALEREVGGRHIGERGRATTAQPFGVRARTFRPRRTARPAVSVSETHRGRAGTGSPSGDPSHAGARAQGTDVMDELDARGRDPGQVAEQPAVLEISRTRSPASTLRPRRPVG